MEPGLDTGPVVLERRVEIGDQDTAASLTERLADEGATAIVEALANLEHLVPKKQSHDGVTYAAKIDKSEAQLDWNQPAIEVWRKVRAYNPVPGASTLLLEQPFKVWEARLVANCHGDPGTVVGEFEGSPVVACSTGGLALTYVQSPGSRRMSGADFLKGHPLPEGARFGA